MTLLFKNSGFIFRRGYLTSKTSFVYKAASSAASLAINTAPQWRVIDRDHWVRVENLVNSMAIELERDLVVYTGTEGHLMLSDTAVNIDGNFLKMKLFLHNDGVTKLFPVPLYFWKVVYEPLSSKGITFITVNNPHMTNPEDHHICETPLMVEDLKILPLKVNSSLFSRGYTYACAVDDFMYFNELTLLGLQAETVTGLLHLPRSRNWNILQEDTCESSLPDAELTDSPNRLIYNEGGDLSTKEAHGDYPKPSTSKGYEHTHDELK